MKIIADSLLFKCDVVNIESGKFKLLFASADVLVKDFLLFMKQAIVVDESLTAET